VARVAAPELPTPAGYTREYEYYPGQEQIAAAARRLVRGDGR
jgi:hypothetical protein